MIIAQPAPLVVLIEWIKKQKEDLRYEGFGGSRNDAPQATENYYDMNQHLLKYCKLCCAQLGLCFVNFGILLLFFVQIKCNAVFLNNIKKEIRNPWQFGMFKM